MCLLSLSEGVFFVQYTRPWSDIPTSITAHWLTFWEELVKTSCMKVAVLLVTLVCIEISCSRETKNYTDKKFKTSINSWISFENIT